MPTTALSTLPPALAVVLEGSGLGGLEGVTRPVCLYLFRNRIDLCENRWCGIDADCAQGQGITDIPRGIAQTQFTVAVLTVTWKADRDFRLALLHMLQITTTVAGVYEAA